MTLRTSFGAVASSLEDAFRIAALRGVLRPAADFFPRRLGLALADGIATILLTFSQSGVAAFREGRRAFGLGTFAALRLARRRVARPLRDYVFMRRVARGREDPQALKLVERGCEGVRQLQAEGRSYIVATAHVARQGMFGMYSPSIAPAHRVHVGAPVPARPRSLEERRAALQYEASLKALLSGHVGLVEVVYVSPEHQSPALPLVRRLRKAVTAVYIHVDAPWAWRDAEKTVHERPFAGDASRTFSIGAARLAKLAKCPIVTCIPIAEDDGSIVLEWGTPIFASDDEAATMDLLLDTIETAIGKRPDQYVLPIGFARRWDARTQRWSDPCAPGRARSLGSARVSDEGSAV